MNTNIYNINFTKLVHWMVPEVLRKPRMMALLNTLVTPIAYLHNQFITNRRSNLYKLLITPQVCYVEMALNDKYDPEERRIRIVLPKSYNPQFLYKRIENKPIYLFRKSHIQPGQYTWLVQKGEASTFQFDFIVKVPPTVVFVQEEMRAVINSYILPEKVYKISNV